MHESGSILPSLESSLNGLTPGQSKSIFVSDKRLSGTSYCHVIIDDVRAATTEEIETGKPLQKLQNKECGPDCCC